MARLTPDGQAVVIRLVYDGPPHSGKTTSLRGLGSGMARTVFSAAEEAGRTLYFDWLEYVGGSFDGIPIHCQILSVPGQTELASRRRALLAEADAVVFVLNSTPEHLPEATAHLGDLRALLGGRSTPRPGIVVQANYRDRPHAVPLTELEAVLGLDGLALVESVATESQGLREAFVLGVRLALERVRALQRTESLPSVPSAIDAPESLLGWLRELEAAEASGSLATGDALPSVQSVVVAGSGPGPAAGPAAVPAVVDDAPRLPDSSAPVGRVWPPIDGRLVLHSAGHPAAPPARTRDGAWRLQSGEWLFHSAPRHEFDHLDDGKQELLGWAQQQAAGCHRLAPQRCIVLADTGRKSWRLWQVVRIRESLRQRLRAAWHEPDPSLLARQLGAAVPLLLAARQAFAAAPELPCGLSLIGAPALGAAELAGPQYIGLLPPRNWRPEEGHRLDAAPLLRRELQSLIEAARQEGPVTSDRLHAALGTLADEAVAGSAAPISGEARAVIGEALEALSIHA